MKTAQSNQSWETKVTKRQYSGKEIQHRAFASRVIVNYYVETLGYHGTNPIINRYEVVCSIEGLDAGFAELCVIGVKALTANEDTLIAEALADLCGWICGAYAETQMPELSDEENSLNAKAKVEL